MVSQSERIGTGVADSGLTMAWKGHPVVDPYLLSLTVRNRGRADLASAMFDAGDDIGVAIFDAELIAVVESKQDFGWFEDHHDNSFSMHFGPALVKVGESRTVTMIVTGKPRLTWSHSLIDVKVEEQTAEEARVSTVGGWKGVESFVANVALAAAGLVVLYLVGAAVIEQFFR